jgi:hypothetical protein
MYQRDAPVPDTPSQQPIKHVVDFLRPSADVTAAAVLETKPSRAINSGKATLFHPQPTFLYGFGRKTKGH